MNKKQIFSAAIVAAIIFLVISIYYIVPGYDHLLVTHDSTSSHPTHFVAFLGLAVVCVFVALVNRPKRVA